MDTLASEGIFQSHRKTNRALNYKCWKIDQNLSIWLYLETRQFFDKLATKHGVDCPEPKTIARLLDRLVGEFLEPIFVNPTFLIGHPQVCIMIQVQAQKSLKRPKYFTIWNFFILASSFMHLGIIKQCLNEISNEMPLRLCAHLQTGIDRCQV